MVEKVVASLVMEKVVAILVVWLPFHDNYTTSLFKDLKGNLKFEHLKKC